jgi:hypothetical protein
VDAVLSELQKEIRYAETPVEDRPDVWAK